MTEWQPIGRARVTLDADVATGIRNLLGNLAQLCDAWRAGEPEAWTQWDQEQRDLIGAYLLILDKLV